GTVGPGGGGCCVLRGWEGLGFGAGALEDAVWHRGLRRRSARGQQKVPTTQRTRSTEGSDGAAHHVKRTFRRRHGLWQRAARRGRRHEKERWPTGAHRWLTALPPSSKLSIRKKQISGYGINPAKLPRRLT